MRWNRIGAALGLSLALVAGALVVLQLLPSPASPEALEAAEARLLAGVNAPIEHRMVQAGDYRLHTIIVGDGSKPPLVMLHGHGGGAAVFAQNFDALSSAYTVYAVDLLGWGRSDRPAFTGQTAEEAQAWWVDSLDAWRQTMGLEQFTLLGHSMGGFVAASYALEHQEHLSHLILVDAGGMSRPVHPFNGIYYNLPPQRLVRLAGPLGPALLRAARGAEATQNPYPPDALMGYYYQLSAAPGSGDMAFRKLLGLNEWALPLLDEIERLQLPTTLIWGEEDTLTTPDNAVRAHELLPASELILIPGAGHAPYDSFPEQFNAAVLDSTYRAP